jgi:hypothetical protein
MILLVFAPFSPGLKPSSTLVTAHLSATRPERAPDRKNRTGRIVGPSKPKIRSRERLPPVAAPSTGQRGSIRRSAMERWLYLRPREGVPGAHATGRERDSHQVASIKEESPATGICACPVEKRCFGNLFLKRREIFFARSIISHSQQGSLNENLKFLPGNMITDGDIKIATQYLREDPSKALYAPMTL